MLSPASAMVVSARNCADWPDDTARAATPPSSAAMRFCACSTAYSHNKVSSSMLTADRNWKHESVLGIQL
eukprot:8231444-Pyramimonas_sp.AAC.1